MKRVLITGSTGLLGHFWVDFINKFYEIILVFHNRQIKNKKFKTIKLDLFDYEKLINTISSLNIDILINLAGISNVDKCESNPDLAYKVNCELPKMLARACRETNTKLIHISTDHFFGDVKKQYVEEDMPILVNEYAKSKYAGESEVCNEYSEALVCRTNFFGKGPIHRQSFSDWIIKTLANEENITLFDDVFFSPIYGYKVPEYTHKLLDLGAKGIYNVSSDDVISKYKFGKFIANTFDLPQKLIKKGYIKNRKDLTKRPLYMGLSNKKASRKLNQSFGKVIDQIALLYEQSEFRIGL